MNVADAAPAEPRMSDLVRVRPGYLRSVQLDRDFSDPSSSVFYVTTPFILSTLDRLRDATRTGSTARAWRLTGDYGSGKSSFCLAFARYASGDLDALPPGFGSVAPEEVLHPVLVVGDREAVSASLCRALRGTLRGLGGRAAKRLRTVLDAAEDGGVDAVVEAVDAVASAVRDSPVHRATGLLVVLDELGKNLEHAAASSQSVDLHVLQRLAEYAARSGDTPVMLVAVLHQAVTAYAKDLSSVERREWEKVSGRFEEVVYTPPVEQGAVMVAAALDVDVRRLPRVHARAAAEAMSKAVGAGWYGAGASAGELADLAPALAPLDPLVLPILVRLLRRFGQNERSLFGFLSSGEPHGLHEHNRREMRAWRPYRLHDLYDYVAANLAGVLDAGTAGVRWGVIDAVVRSAPVESAIERAALKSIGLVNLLDDPGFVMTAGLLKAALAGACGGPDSRAAASAVLRLTRDARLIYDRGVGGGLCLWPHGSVDVDAAFRAASAGQDPAAVADSLSSVLPRDPIVARRHYVQTGALRHFEVVFAQPAELDRVLAAKPDLSMVDGRIVLALSRTEREREGVLARVARFEGWSDLLLVGVTRPIGTLATLAGDVRAWRSVIEDTPALSGDRYARDEAGRQMAMAEERLRRGLDRLVDLRGGSAASATWFRRGERIDVEGARRLTETVSDICDEAYCASPLIRNELLNRRNLSSAAARARSILIEALANGADRPLLGLKAEGVPAEIGIYMSILKAGRVHVESDGGHRITTPCPDPLRLVPSLERVGAVLRTTPDRRVPFEEVAQALRDPPYGVRDGLVPLLVAVYLAIHWHHTAVYEDGTYLDQVGGPEFVRMLKEPEHFGIQHCAIEGVRAEVFARFADLLAVAAPAGPPDLLDVVRPLLRFMARLPDHARRTRRLSAATAAIRAVLLRVQDPTALVFAELPRACGLDPIASDAGLGREVLDAYVGSIASAVGELREAYPALLARVASALAQAMDASGSPEGLQATLARRAERLAPSISEVELKAFAVRLADRGLAPGPWIESLASLLARKPPERWSEADEREYDHRLKLLSRRFSRVEAASGGDAMSSLRPGERAFRIVVTGSDGSEIEDLVRELPDDPRVAKLERKIAALLASGGRAGLVAAARALVGAAAKGVDHDVG